MRIRRAEKMVVLVEAQAQAEPLGQQPLARAMQVELAEAVMAEAAAVVLAQ
jgi:hypothetical protein